MDDIRSVSTMNHLTWHHLDLAIETEPQVDSRRRLRLLLGIFVTAWLLISLRAVQIEWRHGNAFRTEALKPLRREIELPAVRGRLLDRNGKVLAADQQLAALAIHYRYLQQAQDESWLRTQARLRLPKSERRNRDRLTAEIAVFRSEIASLNRRLAALCQIPIETWQARAARIEYRVENIASHVNTRRWERFEQRRSAELSSSAMEPAAWWNVPANLPDALRALGTPEETVWEPVVVKEQVDYHIFVEDLPANIADEIREHADRYPGVRILEVQRRTYPHNTLAANVLGHLGRSETTNAPQSSANTTITTGVLGLEKVLEPRLAGVSGRAIEHTDRRGQLISTAALQPAQNGADVRLTIDARYQQAAEALLDRVLSRSRHARGGAIVFVEIPSGAVLSLASAPRFDPNAFALLDTEAIRNVLSDPGEPMFDRATRMALPPGSLAQLFAAAAMIDSKRVPLHAPFQCEGFLKDPDAQSCPLYRRQGVGHGEITIADALAKNCQMFFAHYAGVLGVEPLVQSASRFGFGARTGIEINEATGTLPQPTTRDAQADYRLGDAQLTAAGQGRFTATTIQMARAIATIAGEGRLPKLTLLADAEIDTATTSSSDVSPTTLSMIRDAMRQAVTNEEGVAHNALMIDGISVAALTATGAVTGDATDHAWCAGFLPADEPRYAFVVAIEHGGDGEKLAGPIAKRFLSRLVQLGCLQSLEASASL
jgi:penicillin-binding protein 2